MKVPYTLKKLCHPNRFKIIEAILNKEKWTWIAVEFNCSQSTITRYRRWMELPTPKRKLTDKQRKEIIRLRKTMKLTELAEMFGVSDSYISKLTHRNASIS